MTPVCRPGFRAVELGGESDCAVKFQFGFKANTSPLLDRILGSLRKEGMSQEEVDHLFNAIVLSIFLTLCRFMVPQIPTFL